MVLAGVIISIAGAISAHTPHVADDDGLGPVRALTAGGGRLVQTSRTDTFGVSTQTQGASGQPLGPGGTLTLFPSLAGFEQAERPGHRPRVTADPDTTRSAEKEKCATKLVTVNSVCLHHAEKRPQHPENARAKTCKDVQLAAARHPRIRGPGRWHRTC